MNRSVALRVACFTAVGIASILAVAGGAPARTGEATEGPCGEAFGAKVCTSYRTKAGKITEISLSVPVAAIEQAPANPPMVWPPKSDASVDFAPAVTEQTGFTFASVYWEPHGHPPQVYMAPHFDFHFYFAPSAQVESVDCKDTTKPRLLPAAYELPDVDIPHIGKLVGVCVPAMGMHAVPSGDLAPGKRWEGSMLAGYYGGKPLFIEPMITSAMLLRKRSFSLAIPEIEAVPNVRYPKRFRGVYDAHAQSYRFVLSY